MKYTHSNSEVGSCEAATQQEADIIFDERLRMLIRSKTHNK
jgi:hypothetical protein